MTPVIVSRSVPMPSIFAPIATRQLAQIDDLGLARGVVDDAGAVGEHGGHDDVLGRADRDAREGVAPAGSPLGAVART